MDIDLLISLKTIGNFTRIKTIYYFIEATSIDLIVEARPLLWDKVFSRAVRTVP